MWHELNTLGGSHGVKWISEIIEPIGMLPGSQLNLFHQQSCPVKKYIYAYWYSDPDSFFLFRRKLVEEMSLWKDCKKYRFLMAHMWRMTCEDWRSPVNAIVHFEAMVSVGGLIHTTFMHIHRAHKTTWAPLLATNIWFFCPFQSYMKDLVSCYWSWA